MISLSNYYNPYFVLPQLTAEKVVIDSNKRAEERIQKFLQAQSPETAPDGDGFVAGLAVQEVQREDPEEILRKARAEAAEIVDAARKEADSFLKDAKKKASEMYEEQRREGFEEGNRQSREETERLRQELELDYQRRLDEYYDDYVKEYQRIEPDLVDTMIRVFDRIFGIQFEDKRPIILSLVDQTMRGAESAKQFMIRVSEANRSFLEEHIEELRSRVTADVEIHVASDAALTDEYCRIETEYGVYDCSIDTELSNLFRDIRSLCGS